MEKIQTVEKQNSEQLNPSVTMSDSSSLANEQDAVIVADDLSKHFGTTKALDR